MHVSLADKNQKDDSWIVKDHKFKLKVKGTFLIVIKYVLNHFGQFFIARSF